jgi:hypothetical protein
VLENFNKKRYMLAADMVPLSQLQKSARFAAGYHSKKSSIFETEDSSRRERSTSSQTRAPKGGQKFVPRGQMDEIISYRDSLAYRDEKIQAKVNYESHNDIVQRTKQIINEANS